MAVARKNKPRSRNSSAGVRPYDAPPHAPLFHPDDWSEDVHTAAMNYAKHVYPSPCIQRATLADRAERAWLSFVKWGEVIPRFRTLDEVDAWRAARGLPSLAEIRGVPARYRDLADRLAGLDAEEAK